MIMKGIKESIHDALIDLVVNREHGKYCYAQFTCEFCLKNCTIPREGESKTMILCCRCSEMNYLTEYEVIVH